MKRTSKISILSIVFISAAIAFGFQNCQNSDFQVSMFDSSATAVSSSNTSSNRQVLVTASADVMQNCSSGNSFFYVTASGLGQNLRYCVQRTDSSANYQCDSPGKFATVQNVFSYTAGNDTWMTENIYTQNNGNYIKGTYVFLVKDENGANYMSNSIQVGNSGALNCNTTTTTNPPASQSADPGIGSGLWLPPNTSNIFVVDQTGSIGATSNTASINYVPGCLNGMPPPMSSSSGCAAQTALSATYAGRTSSINLSSPSHIISIRVQSSSSIANFQKVTLSASNGGSLGYAMRLWLSASAPGTPGGNYDDVPAQCRKLAAGQIDVYVHSTQCQVQPGTLYYINIKGEGVCSSDCRYQLDEGDAFN